MVQEPKPPAKEAGEQAEIPWYKNAWLDFDSFARPIDFLNLDEQTTMRTSCGSCLSLTLSGLMCAIIYILVNTLLDYNDIDVQSSSNARALMNDESPVSFEEGSLLWALEIDFGILYGDAWSTDLMKEVYLSRNKFPSKGIQMKATITQEHTDEGWEKEIDIPLKLCTKEDLLKLW